MNLQNHSREVGIFQVFSAPKSPIGTFDSEGFKEKIRFLLAEGKKNIAVDLSALDFLYSDAYNAFIASQSVFEKEGAILGLLTENRSISDNLSKLHFNSSIFIFQNETEILEFSEKLFSAKSEIITHEMEDALLSPETVPEKEPPVSCSAERVESPHAVSGEESFENQIIPETFLVDEPGRRFWPWVLLITLMAAFTIFFLLYR